MLNSFRRTADVVRWLASLQARFPRLELMNRGDYKHAKVLSGTIMARLNELRAPSALRDVEFQVFSQFGDDGIIQFLTYQLGITEQTFVEFGVEDYTEANTRFLLVKDKWRGLVLDGQQRHIDYIDADPVSTLFDLTSVQTFITAENINDIIAAAGFRGRIGLLSIDIDGMDYWVWRAMDVVDPAIVIVEYNAIFGPERAIVAPYAADFVRERVHPSRLYWGASLAAFQHLAIQKGYLFVGCNGNGNNAYFVRREYAGHPVITALKPTFQPASFAEYVQDGRRVRGEQAGLEVIRGLPVINVVTDQPETL